MRRWNPSGLSKVSRLLSSVSRRCASFVELFKNIIQTSRRTTGHVSLSIGLSLVTSVMHLPLEGIIASRPIFSLFLLLPLVYLAPLNETIIIYRLCVIMRKLKAQVNDKSYKSVSLILKIKSVWRSLSYPVRSSFLLVACRLLLLNRHRSTKSTTAATWAVKKDSRHSTGMILRCHWKR